METLKKEVNPEIDVTKFVNIDDKPYDIYIGGKVVRHLEAGEENICPIFVAQVGAKHLVDRILQEKHNVADTLTDTPLRKSLFAKILPEMAEQRNIKPLSPEQELEEVKKEQKKQRELVEAFFKTKSEKEVGLEEKVKELEKELAKLKEEK